MAYVGMTGGELWTRSTGNSSTNYIYGLDGNDTIDGGTGSENLPNEQGAWFQLTSQTSSTGWGVLVIPKLDTLARLHVEGFEDQVAARQIFKRCKLVQ